MYLNDRREVWGDNFSPDFFFLMFKAVFGV